MDIAAKYYSWKRQLAQRTLLNAPHLFYFNNNMRKYQVGEKPRNDFNEI